MKISELITKTEEQLFELLKQLKKEALNLRFQKATGELENTSRVRDVRRAVAKIKTILRQRTAVGGKNA